MIAKHLDQFCADGKKKKAVTGFLKTLPEELQPTVGNLFLQDLENTTDDEDKFEQEIRQTIVRLRHIQIKKEQTLLRQKIETAENGGKQDELKQLKDEFIRLSRQLTDLHA